MSNLLSSLPTLFICLLACWTGIQLFGCFLSNLPRRFQVFGGMATGLALLAWIGYLAALVLGLNPLSISISAGALIVISISTFAIGRPLTLSISNLRGGKWSILYLAGWTVLFSWQFSRVITIEPDGLHTAPANNFGDLGFHFSVVTSFADAANIPPTNPVFAGIKFTYPFLIDFLTGFFHAAGADWRLAFFMPNLLLVVALTALIQLLTEELTGSRRAGLLAPFLFFFSGGLGFYYFLRDARNAETGWVDFLLHLPQSYTKNDGLFLEWGNSLTTLLIPQRSFLFGLPVFVLIVILWSRACVPDRRTPENLVSGATVLSERRQYLLAAGVLAGLTPLLHAHGFFSIMLVSVCMALFFYSMDWLYFFIPAGLLAFPQALWLSGTGTRESLFKPHFGWAAGEAPMAKFWILNFGLFLGLLALSLILRTPRSIRFYLPFLLCFIVPNVVLLAPWPWDNIKVLLYWYIASCPLVAALLVKLSRSKWLITPGLALFVGLILSGFLDVWRGLTPVENARLFTREQLTVSELIKQGLPPRALILSAPIHNSVLALTGRQMLIGYPGHLWSHGIKFEERYLDAKSIYAGGTDAIRLLRLYDINYVIIGPAELEQMAANVTFFDQMFPVVIDSDGYRVYETGISQKLRP